MGYFKTKSISEFSKLVFIFNLKNKISMDKDGYYNEEKQYLHLLEKVLFQGEDRDDRTGIGTKMYLVNN